jgi:hypothetical protein
MQSIGDANTLQISYCIQHRRHYEEFRLLGCEAMGGFVRTDVSEESVSSIFRVEVIGKLGTLEYLATEPHCAGILII